MDSNRVRKLSKSRRVSSSSDEDSGPSVRKLSSASQKKKKRVTALEETDSDWDNAEDIALHTESRSSERLNERNSRSFQMPSRDSIWNSIPSTPTSNKAIYRLKPRRVVKSFTKITHRYNQDVCYSEEDESDTDDFIAPDGKVSDSEEDDSDGKVSDSEEDDSNGNRKSHHQKIQGAVKRGRHHRIRGYHPKILDTASMSSESDVEGKAADVKNRNNSTGLVKYGRDRHGDTYSSGVDNYKQCVETSSEWRSKSGRAKRQHSQIVSSSDSDHSTGTSANELQHCRNSDIENANTNVENKCHNSMEMTVENSKKPGVVQALFKSPVPACGAGTYKTDSGSEHESDDCSDDCSNSGSVSNSTSKSESPYSDSDHEAQHDFENVKSIRARHQIQKQESAKKQKFEAFLEARRKVSASKRN
ncbi:protein IWS1 homolog A-like isoform X1 [Mizuhopecten yessoensis]|uniref:protein IWS1 homolog A-like isoform X1 n=1 Tax=Mizuhopecten yessoensis TaxID=6573 RepID=UPI000B457288|nr:protein IWS1 homolog A-like isoform X1 [Mizuhopecten yessoensis]